MVPVREPGFLPSQRGEVKVWGEEVEREEPHRLAPPVASDPPAPSAHPYAPHTERSAPPAP